MVSTRLGSSNGNRLYYGDNLDVLRRHVADESVDLVYLDPPFNSNANYNVLFAEHDGRKAASQLHAFEDTWTWNEESERAYAATVEQGGRVSECLQAFRTFLGQSDMMAYLAMMAPRLVELRRVLKPTGSLYLHCDSAASHYLKMLLDAIFGPVNFRNEIIWKRTSGHSDARRQFADQTDTLLFYGCGPTSCFNVQHTAYSDKYVASHYASTDPDGRQFTTRDLRSPHPRPNLTYVYKGYQPHPNGWSVSLQRMKELDAAGLLYFPSSKTGRIRLKRYLDESHGARVGNLWDDISPINSQAQERLGYPTQKPVALVERIIRASSNDGDVILDPFCGCGSTIAAAEHVEQRRWIGIDITQAAIVVIKQRFRDQFGTDLPCEVIGEPACAEDAAGLAAEDPYQFQWWALGLVDARPSEGRKGADKGIDGRRYFVDPETGKAEQIIFSVKAGHLQPAYVRELRGVIDREHAAMGALLTMEAPTRQMLAEAAAAGFVETAWGRYPRLQILPVADRLNGKMLEAPPARQLDITYKRAPRAASKAAEQPSLYAVEPKPAKATIEPRRHRRRPA